MLTGRSGTAGGGSGAGVGRVVLAADDSALPGDGKACDAGGSRRLGGSTSAGFSSAAGDDVVPIARGAGGSGTGWRSSCGCGSGSASGLGGVAAARASAVCVSALGFGGGETSGATAGAAGVDVVPPSVRSVGGALRYNCARPNPNIPNNSTRTHIAPITRSQPAGGSCTDMFDASSTALGLGSAAMRLSSSTISGASGQRIRASSRASRTSSIAPDCRPAVACSMQREKRRFLMRASNAAQPVLPGCPSVMDGLVCKFDAERATPVELRHRGREQPLGILTEEHPKTVDAQNSDPWESQQRDRGQHDAEHACPRFEVEESYAGDNGGK